MMQKIIVFDVDGVIIDSATKKFNAFSRVIKDFWLYDNPEVRKVLEDRVSRNFLAQKIYEVSWIPHQKTLIEISRSLSLYETPWNSYPAFQTTLDFIHSHYNDYVYFTNTAMDSQTVVPVFKELWILRYFEEILWYNTGTKKENIEYILRNHECTSKDILFIDDLQYNIDNVVPTWVHTLLFLDDWISLEEKVWSIFWK